MTQVNATLPDPDSDPAAAGGAPRPSAAELRFVRSDHIAAAYSPWRHMALTVVLASVLATGGLALAARGRASDWLFLPVFLVIANLIEWMVHRHPMHRPLRPRIMYRNHAQLHHLAFTDGQMVIGPTRDLGLIMMPWYTMLGLFVLASPVMIVAGLLRGPGLAGVFLVGAVAYFLCYELLHALYHLPDAVLDRAGIGRVRAFRRLQAHHRHHHILGRMAAVNFNVTVPLWDRVFGTLEK